MGIKRPWHRWRLIALLMVALLLPMSTRGEVFAQTAGSCTVTYSIVAQWPGSFLAELAVKNSGTSTINGWTVSWTFPNGQKINQVTSSTFTQTAADVMLKNVAWNATIAPGGTQAGGLYIMANWSGTNNPPASIVCRPS